MATPSAPSTPSPAVLLRRVGEWLWRGDALRDARARVTPLTAAQRASVGDARDALSLAERLVDAAGISAPAIPDARAATLAWTLLSDAARRLDAARADDTPPAVARALGSPRPPDEDPDVTRRALADARAYLHARCDDIDPRAARIPRLHGERALRVALVAGALVAARGAWPVVDTLRRPDLAPDAPWRASSAASAFATTGRGFAPPASTSPVFMHTAQEHSPWVQFDLGAPRSIRLVVVHNRWDCCVERAVPLVVELSDDASAWRGVADRRGPFYVWSTSFTPQRARYVRIRATSDTMLHLARVEIR